MKPKSKSSSLSKVQTCCSSLLVWAVVQVLAVHLLLQRLLEMGILTVAVVTKPFLFEGKGRMDCHRWDCRAPETCRFLDHHSEQMLLSVLGKSVTLLSAFALRMLSCRVLLRVFLIWSRYPF